MLVKDIIARLQLKDPNEDLLICQYTIDDIMTIAEGLEVTNFIEDDAVVVLEEIENFFDADNGLSTSVIECAIRDHESCKE